jgi:hypothetical protein
MVHIRELHKLGGLWVYIIWYLQICNFNCIEQKDLLNECLIEASQVTCDIFHLHLRNFTALGSDPAGYLQYNTWKQHSKSPL